MFGEQRCLLRLKLVEDLPGEHVYIHACKHCGREYGHEFSVFHASTGTCGEPAPVVRPAICAARLPQPFVFGVAPAALGFVDCAAGMVAHA